MVLKPSSFSLISTPRVLNLAQSISSVALKAAALISRLASNARPKNKIEIISIMLGIKLTRMPIVNSITNSNK